MTTERLVAEHYGRDDLAGVILAALREAGVAADPLTAEDLAPVDQFHLRGRDATLQLAQRGGLLAKHRVLDVGGGIGGPARMLASRLGCRVVVVDLTEPYLEAGRRLTGLVGLEARVEFHFGSALQLPFPDGSFDVVWTQHATMNIADKVRLYAEVARILPPGGRLLLHEIVAGKAAPPLYPVPWAHDPSISFLLPEAEMRTTIAGAGLRELAWHNERETTLAWLAERAAAARSGAAGVQLGVHVLLGSAGRLMLANLARSVEEERVSVVQGIFERAGG